VKNYIKGMAEFLGLPEETVSKSLPVKNYKLAFGVEE